MSDPFARYDAWLEAPYVDRAKQEADFERWCEAEGLTWLDDRGEAEAWERYEEWLLDQEPDIPEPPDDWDVDPRDFD